MSDTPAWRAAFTAWVNPTHARQTPFERNAAAWNIAPVDERLDAPRHTSSGPTAPVLHGSHGSTVPTR